MKRRFMVYVVLFLLERLAESTDNKVDDTFVLCVRRLLLPSGGGKDNGFTLD